jgi:hypothetical protein
MFMKIHRAAAGLFHEDRRMGRERQNEDNSRFSRFCERALKIL